MNIGQVFISNLGNEFEVIKETSCYVTFKTVDGTTIRKKKSENGIYAISKEETLNNNEITNDNDAENITVSDKELKNINMVLNKFKAPKWFVEKYGQICSIPSSTSIFSLDADDGYTKSVAIVEFKKHNSLMDNNQENDIIYHYSKETKNLYLDNFEKQADFGEFNIKEIVSAYNKISFIKPCSIESFNGFYLNNNNLIATDTVAMGKVELKSTININSKLSKNIMDMLKNIYTKLKINSATIGELNNTVYIKIDCANYIIKIASNSSCVYFDYQAFFDAQHKYILSCNFNEYCTVFKSIDSIIKEQSSKDEYSTCLTKNNIYLLKNREPIFYAKISAKLTPKFIIKFNQNYILDFLNSNKNSNNSNFELRVNGSNDSIRIDFENVSYILMPIMVSKYSANELLQKFTNCLECEN